MARSRVDNILVKFDKDTNTNMYLRACRTPDRNSVIGTWALYEDVNSLLPSKKGWKPPESPCPLLFDIVPIKSKGRGLIAARNIKKGELIIRERPILMIPRVVYFENRKYPWFALDKLTLQLVYWLEYSDREKFLQLHNCKSPDECGPLVGILRTNSVPASFPESRICPQYSCVCLNMSYANHSCDPNAVQKFDRRTFAQELYATRDIAEKEEITVGYVTIIAPRVERQEQLQTKYGFTCTCMLCSKPDPYASQSDEMRQRINMALRMFADGHFRSQLAECSPADEKQVAQRQIEFMRAILLAMKIEDVSEGRILFTQYLASLYALFADLENFRKWVGECLKILEEEKQFISDWETLRSQWQFWNRNPTLLDTWGTLR